MKNQHVYKCKQAVIFELQQKFEEKTQLKKLPKVVRLWSIFGKRRILLVKALEKRLSFVAKISSV